MRYQPRFALRTCAALLGAALWCLATLGSGAEPHALTGSWRLNLPATDELAVDYEAGSGIEGGLPLRTQVTVMGLPLPSRAKSSPMSGLPARDPDVLLCTEMTLTIDGGRVRLNYDHGASETLREGEYRGRTTRVSRRKIEESYKTTERTVRKTWELRKDGTLLVSVRIKYRGDKAQTYQRVFDLSANTTATDAAP